MTTKLICAMAAYGVLALMAGWTLGDAAVMVGQSSVELRVAVWILLGGFALKTLIAWGRYRAEANEDAARESENDPR
ncbi:MAG: hypothetical protein JST11_00430 [Acidobacteria bacterium]|nr:hypothetical protein [Acidobacteriota bacterium]